MVKMKNLLLKTNKFFQSKDLLKKNYQIIIIVEWKISVIMLEYK
ncbi:hypothetical protein [Vagococcus carniphilus]